MAASILDSIAALRVAYLLITPIENTNAFILGLIDKDGKTVKKAITSEEKNSTSMLHRMCWNLKRLIGIIPGGSTKIGSLAAAYLLMKEAVENDWSEAQLHENCIDRFSDLCEQDCADLDTLLDELFRLYEDAPANSTGSAVSVDLPTKKIDLIKRKQLKIMELK